MNNSVCCCSKKITVDEINLTVDVTAISGYAAFFGYSRSFKLSFFNDNYYLKYNNKEKKIFQCNILNKNEIKMDVYCIKCDLIVFKKEQLLKYETLRQFHYQPKNIITKYLLNILNNCNYNGDCI